MSRSRSRSRSPARTEEAAPPPADVSQAVGDDADVNGGGGGGDDEVKLYVGNLSYETDDARLREEFSVFGTVTDVFLPTERHTGRPRGFGFVTMSTRASAEDAIAKMDQSQLEGRTIRVNESKPRGEGPADKFRSSGFNTSGNQDVKLYVGNLSYETQEQGVRELFEQYGAVSDCFLPTDRDTGRPRGFAFVTMVAAEAEKACNATNGYELDGRPLKVNEAQPKGYQSGAPRPGEGGYGGGYGGEYGGGYGGGGGYPRADERGGYGG